MEGTQTTVIGNVTPDSKTEKPIVKEEVKTPASTTTETKNETNEKFDNTEDQNKSNEKKADETTADTKKADEEKERIAQSKKDNERFAKERREREAKEKALKEVEHKAYVKGLLESVDNKNPFTNEAIVDEHDIQEYLTMREMDKKGLDPIADYHKFTKQQAKEKQTQENQVMNKRDENWYLKDREEFEAKHPDTSLEKLQEDSRFVKFAKAKVGVQPLNEIYEDYTSLLEEFDAETDKKIRKAVAKAMSTPGSASATEPPKDEFFTLDQIKKMTQAEVDANFDKVQASMAKALTKK